MLYADYFADEPLHDGVVFQRSFRMDQKLLMKIVLVGTPYKAKGAIAVPINEVNN
jgi:hypothetical protein